MKAVIFDMDGVIVNTEKLYAESAMATFSKYGVNLTEQEYYDFWTRDGGKTADFFEKKNVTNLNVIQIRDEKRAIFLEEMEKDPRIIDGAPEKVKELGEKYPLALVTSSHIHVVDIVLKHSGIKDCFSVVLAEDNVKHSKPNPEGFLLAAEKLKVNPKECVVIEDAEKGVIAAKEAGMKCIAIPNKYTENNDFSRADIVINNIKEISDELIRKL